MLAGPWALPATLGAAMAALGLAFAVDALVGARHPVATLLVGLWLALVGGWFLYAGLWMRRHRDQGHRARSALAGARAESRRRHPLTWIIILPVVLGLAAGVRALAHGASIGVAIAIAAAGFAVGAVGNTILVRRARRGGTAAERETDGRRAASSP
jgi:hypothetical protein